MLSIGKDHDPVRIFKAAMPYHQITIAIPEQVKDPLLRKLAELGSLGSLDQGHTITSYFSATAPLGSIIGELQVLSLLAHAAGFDIPVRIEYRLLPDTDWNESWKKGFTSIDVGERFAILPPWERPTGGRIPLIIDPGMAFGTGHHETTRSCLVLMERYVNMVKAERFLDLGTGTGLLAIAALALGFQSVVGVDTDPMAIEASIRNVALNKRERIDFFEGGIDQCEGEFNMITANLISGTLVHLADKIASRLVPAGIVIMSGILKGQDDEVIEAAKSSGMDCIERLVDGKWVSLACRR
jgi:ribosomal protein L11 methyltransferase